MCLSARTELLGFVFRKDLLLFLCPFPTEEYDGYD